MPSRGASEIGRRGMARSLIVGVSDKRKGAFICLAGVIGMNPNIYAGDVWRSSKTWWRVLHKTEGVVYLEGPRGSVRSSRDGGETWSELFKTMTMDGFLSWIRKTGALRDVNVVPAG